MRSFYSKVEGAMKLKFVSFCSSCDALSDGILVFADVKIFRFWPKTIIIYITAACVLPLSAIGCHHHQVDAGLPLPTAAQEDDGSHTYLHLVQVRIYTYTTTIATMYITH